MPDVHYRRLKHYNMITNKKMKASKSMSNLQMDEYQAFPKPPKRGTLWQFSAFTKKSVAFNAAARKLAAMLANTYGESVTIPQFEKLLAAYSTMEKEKKDLLHTPEDLVELYEEYVVARTALDIERKSLI